LDGETAAVEDVGVDLGGGDVAVTEEFLDEGYALRRGPNILASATTVARSWPSHSTRAVIKNGTLANRVLRSTRSWRS
jgi:hypothetical protein